MWGGGSILVPTNTLESSLPEPVVIMVLWLILFLLRSEVLRRNAERKAMSLEQELISARSQLDVKSAEYAHLSAQLSTEKSSREQLRNEMDLMIKSAVEEGKAQVRQSLQLIETEKKSLEAANVRLEADLVCLITLQNMK